MLRLGQGAKALGKAIDSGDTDLIYHVILNLQEEHSTADFHMIMRGVKLGARYQHFQQSVILGTQKLHNFFQNHFLASTL